MKKVTLASHLYILLLISLVVFSYMNPDRRINAQPENPLQLIEPSVVENVEELYVLGPHPNGVDALALSGATLVSGAFGQFDNLIKWDLNENPEPGFTNLNFHNGDVTSIDINLNSTRMLTGSVNRDSYLLLTDLTTNEIVYELLGHRNWVLSVAISDDGTRGLSGSADTTAIYWDLDTGEQLQTYTGQRDSVFAVDLSPDNVTAASSSCGQYVRSDNGGLECVKGKIDFWSLVDGELVSSIEAHEGIIFSIEYSNDGTQLISGAADGRLILWDVNTGEIVREFRTEQGNAHGRSTIRSVSYNPDNRLVVSGSRDGTIRIWEVSSGELLRTIPIPSSVRNRVVYSTAFGEFYLAAGIASGDVYVYGIPSR